MIAAVTLGMAGDLDAGMDKVRWEVRYKNVDVGQPGIWMRERIRLGREERADRGLRQGEDFKTRSEFRGVRRVVQK